MTKAKDPVLTVDHVSLSFGGIQAVDDVSFEVERGSLMGLIGPNGAGKTSIFNVITGIYQPTQGRVLVDGVDIKGMKNHEIVEAGLARTFQNIRLFKKMSIMDNVLASLNNSMSYNKLEGMFRLPEYWREEAQMREKALELLSLFRLDHLAEEDADSLPYGEQRKLEIVRALATDPKLLLLDEPAAGMNPIETEELMSTIDLIRQQFGVSILLIEHDMKLVLGICEHLVVMNQGSVIAEGDPHEVVKRAEVVTAYLGEEDL